MDELLSSPLGILLLARSIIEVSGTPPGMHWREHLECSSAEDLASCLQTLALRVPGEGYFDHLSAERLSELLVQSKVDFPPWNDRYCGKQTSCWPRAWLSGRSPRLSSQLLAQLPGLRIWIGSTRSGRL